MERNGFRVAGYDLDAAKTSAFVQGPGRGKNVAAARSPEELVGLLEKPRRILIMVPAGPAVDSAVEHLKGRLESGDILIDGGNSFFLDTERRCRQLAEEGLRFVGTGVSGGEAGALWGPSIMPGGAPEAWEALAPILRGIAAKAADGEPCVDYMGPGGAGHFVKMVHNGIEYGDMQLIAETYDLLARGLRLPAACIRDVFLEWNRGELGSYLIEVTAAVLGKIDPGTGLPLVDLILDEAQQKGTGKWTSQNALDIGAPIPTINAAVESRILSSLKEERVQAGRILRGPAPARGGEPGRLIEAAGRALYASKILSYAQGLGLLRIASREYGYGFRPGGIAKIWRAGCIIRARLLADIVSAYGRNPELVNLMLDDSFREAIDRDQGDLRLVIQTAVGMGIPVPAMSASLAYFDAYRSERLPANLTQAQRDYFGAHTYRRIDKPGVFHTAW
jgi:6-phosphogluconate dehydrogenase